MSSSEDAVYSRNIQEEDEKASLKSNSSKHMLVHGRKSEGNFSGFASKDVGPLNHYDCNKIAGLGIENRLSGVSHLIAGDCAGSTNDISCPVENLTITAASNSCDCWNRITNCICTQIIASKIKIVVKS